LDWIARIAEERIKEAMERGEFDNLPFKGEPVPLDSNPYVPEDLRLAYRLLKQHGFLPPELELRREIVTLEDLLRAAQDGEERLRLRRRLNERLLRLSLLREKGARRGPPGKRNRT
jgi:hypothetical protein